MRGAYARRTDAHNVQKAIRRRGWGGDENGRYGPSVHLRGRQRQARSLETAFGVRCRSYSMTIALRFIIADSRVDITLRVTSFSGAFRITTSEAQQLVEKREADVRLVLGEPEDVVVTNVHVEDTG